jgi:hypothetical protein
VHFFLVALGIGLGRIGGALVLLYLGSLFYIPGAAAGFWIGVRVVMNIHGLPFWISGVLGEARR